MLYWMARNVAFFNVFQSLLSRPLSLWILHKLIAIFTSYSQHKLHSFGRKHIYSSLFCALLSPRFAFRFFNVKVKIITWETYLINSISTQFSIVDNNFKIKQLILFPRSFLKSTWMYFMNIWGSQGFSVGSQFFEKFKFYIFYILIIDIWHFLKFNSEQYEG